MSQDFQCRHFDISRSVSVFLGFFSVDGLVVVFLRYCSRKECGVLGRVPRDVMKIIVRVAFESFDVHYINCRRLRKTRLLSP